MEIIKLQVFDSELNYCFKIIKNEILLKSSTLQN